jgi:hypothetical protein
VPVRKLNEFELGQVGFTTMGHGQEVVAGAAGTALLITMDEQHRVGYRDDMVLKLEELSYREFMLRSEELWLVRTVDSLCFPDPSNP